MQSAQAYEHMAMAIDDSSVCPEVGCGGIVLRHSLGCAQSVYRCTRCFRTFDRSRAARPGAQSRMARIWAELRSWREDGL